MARVELTPVEAELLRLLSHARSCDGVRCPICERIDLRLADGPSYAGDDPVLRYSVIEAGLLQLVGRLERLYQLIEGAKLAPGTLREVQALVEGTTKVVNYLRLPLSKEDRHAQTQTRKGDKRSARRAPATQPAGGGAAPRGGAGGGVAFVAQTTLVAGGTRTIVRRAIAYRGGPA